MKAKHSMFTNFFYQNLVFQTFENMTFLYLYIYKQTTKYNESDKKTFSDKGNCYKNPIFDTVLYMYLPPPGGRLTYL